MSSRTPNLGYSDNNSLNLLSRTSSDSILSTIDNKPIILYMAGHHAHIWSIIIKNDEKFQALSGRVNSYGENIISKPIESNLFDSVAFFSKYKHLLLWGFDSLTIEVQRMKPIKKNVYNPIYSSLFVFPLNTAPSFDLNDAVTFAGPDSIEFNKKIDSLSLLMYWIAEPLIRPYTPDSLYIYTNRLTNRLSDSTIKK